MTLELWGCEADLRLAVAVSWQTSHKPQAINKERLDSISVLCRIWQSEGADTMYCVLVAARDHDSKYREQPTSKPQEY